jgi:hypothetical protein
LIIIYLRLIDQSVHYLYDETLLLCSVLQNKRQICEGRDLRESDMLVRLIPAQ